MTVDLGLPMLIQELSDHWLKTSTERPAGMGGLALSAGINDVGKR